MIDVVPLIKEASGCDYHRLRLPFEHMDTDWDRLKTDSAANLLKECKMIIFNRTPGFDFDQILSLRRKFDFKMICDIDDYWQLASNSIHYGAWKATGMQQKIMESLMNSDFVFASTARVAEQVVKYNKNVVVVPNAIPFGKGQFTEMRIPADKPRIMYAGGVSHFWDLHAIRGVFDKLARTPDKHEVQLAGYASANEASQKYWDSVEKIVTGGGKAKYYQRKYMLTLDQYMNHYTTCDVSLAPLEITYFNSFKSNLKVLEAGCKNIPIVTSWGPPYSDEPGEVVQMARSTGDWFNLLHRYIKNPALRQDHGEALGRHVREHYSMDKANEIRQQVFNHLMK